jgi:adenine-specific DNA-methyltransferase
MDLLVLAEKRRRAALEALDGRKQALMGQYFTPAGVARIIASLPRLPRSGHLHVLDPGAGSGILTAALVDRILRQAPDLTVSVTAVESDPTLHDALAETLADCRHAGVETRLIGADFPSWALSTDERFDLIIQNPPYAKLRSGSCLDQLLRPVGIAVPNMYAAFMALGARILAEGGQQVSITPRSWMNGTYYADFRRALLHRVGIDAIHTFASRSTVFGDMGVLQESIIISGTLGGRPESVQLYSSHDDADLAGRRTVPYDQVVTPDFVFVPENDRDADAVSWMQKASCSLDDLWLTVSTGRVVDFRCREFLFEQRSRLHSPMVYPANIRCPQIVHPRADLNKAQWFDAATASAAKLLVPAGTYVLIKRFSAKEEKRRIVAAVWTGDVAPAFDNKLNYIHEDGHGLAPDMAQGLAMWLNSTQVDDYFRVFSGHTQVNAGDLRRMTFPTREQLRALAQARQDIDTAVEHVMTGKAEIAA